MGPLLFGLATSIRPTEVLIGLIPLIILFKAFGNTKQFWRTILLFPAMSLLWNIPQILYWKLVGGELITANLHTEDIVLSDPNILNFLLSYRKGWLLYTPILLTAIWGGYYAYKINKTLFWAISSFLLLFTYIVCSWETWYYATSYSSRVMVDIYPVMAILIAILISEISKKWMRIALLTFSMCCILLNGFQSRQVELGYLHNYRMTSEHYWYIFGKLHIPKYDESRLLIDRTNFGWVNYQKKNKQSASQNHHKRPYSVHRTN